MNRFRRTFVVLLVVMSLFVGAIGVASAERYSGTYDPLHPPVIVPAPNPLPPAWMWNPLPPPDYPVVGDDLHPSIPTFKR